MHMNQSGKAVDGLGNKQDRTGIRWVTHEHEPNNSIHVERWKVSAFIMLYKAKLILNKISRWTTKEALQLQWTGEVNISLSNRAWLNLQRANTFIHQILMEYTRHRNVDFFHHRRLQQGNGEVLVDTLKRGGNA